MSQWLFSFTSIFKHSDALENYVIKRAAEYIKNGLLLNICLFCIAIPFLTLANDHCYYFSLNHLITWLGGEGKGKRKREEEISPGWAMPLVNREQRLSQKSAASLGCCSEMVSLASRGYKRPQSYCLVCLCQHARNPAMMLLLRDGQSMHKALAWEGSPIQQQQLFPALTSSSAAEAANSSSHRLLSPGVISFTLMLADVFHICFTSVPSCTSLTPIQYRDVQSIFKE